MSYISKDMNFIIFRDFSRFFKNFSELKINLFELNSVNINTYIYIYIYHMLTWQVLWHGRKSASPCGGVRTCHMAAHRCSRVCIRMCVCTCEHVTGPMITCILYMNYMIINATKSINFSIYMHVITF